MFAAERNVCGWEMFVAGKCLQLRVVFVAEKCLQLREMFVAGKCLWLGNVCS